MAQLFDAEQPWRVRYQLLRRAGQVFGFAARILFYTWFDAQLWTYVGQQDVDWAQSQRRKRHARWVTQQLLRLGPTFIKVGQSLSTRVDLLRKETIDALATLQDRVPAFDIAEAREILTRELGGPPEDVLAWFDPQPLAAASLGQVHRARLVTGEDIVLKIQRPRLVQTFLTDLAILRRFAQWLEKSTELARGREWVGVVDAFGQTLFEEIDYRREGKNAERFVEAFRNKPPEPGIVIVIPAIYWHYTTATVLAMAYAPGIKINDVKALHKAGLPCDRLALAILKAYFQQLLVDGAFHADPHPGNIAIRPSDSAIILYDFGMVGIIDNRMRLKIVETFLNIVQKKPDDIMNNLLELDMIAPNADLDVIRQVIVWALDNYYDTPHDQLNFEQLTDEMAELMYAHPFKLPPSFTNMIRALLTLEGVATTLHPSIRFMGVAVDYAQTYLMKSLGWPQLLRKGFEWFGLLPAGETGASPIQMVGMALQQLLAGLGVGAMLGSGSGGLGAALGGSLYQRRRIPRVRLLHDEWTPLARYLKFGLCAMALGQMLMVLCLFLLLIPEGSAVRTLIAGANGRMSSWMWLLLIMLAVGYGVLMLGLLVWLPARRTPIRFEPNTRRVLPKK